MHVINVISFECITVALHYVGCADIQCIILMYVIIHTVSYNVLYWLLQMASNVIAH